MGLNNSLGVRAESVSVGTRCWVRVGNSAADCKKIGMIDNVTYTINYQTQKAAVIGSILAASIDVVGLDVSGSFSGFIADPKLTATSGVNGIGDGASIKDFNVSPLVFIDGVSSAKYDYMDLYDDKKKIRLFACKDVIISNYQVTTQAGAYTKGSVQFQALESVGAKDLNIEQSIVPDSDNADSASANTGA